MIPLLVHTTNIWTTKLRLAGDITESALMRAAPIDTAMLTGTTMDRLVSTENTIIPILGLATTVTMRNNGNGDSLENMRWAGDPLVYRWV
jgi:hypothetical protein